MEPARAFGCYLRAERELRQIPLSEVADATKIPERALQQLEDGSWKELPAEVFVRGFVRSYARHVGLPVEEACSRYVSTLAMITDSEQELTTTSVGDAAAEVGGRRRFGLALFVIIMLIIATITLSIIWHRGASADTPAASLESQPASLSTARSRTA